VLPVGGIKEKVLAAHRAGITLVILPSRNEADLEDLPQEVLEQIKFVFVENIHQVLDASLDPLSVDGTKKKKRVVRKKAALSI
jgi:ATP-dependent Lon protease